MKGYAGDVGSIPRLERSLGEEMTTHFSIQYSWLENPIYRRAWQGIVYSIAKDRHDCQTQYTFNAYGIYFFLIYL